MILGALILVALGWNLGAYPLLDPDEGRNAEIAREMIESGDYTRPTLNGISYLDKPFLYFAATAVSMKVLGQNELGARLPSFLAAVLTVILLFAWGRRNLQRDEAWLAAVALTTAPLMIGFSRVVIFDSTLTLLVAAGILSFHTGLESTKSDEGYWWVVGGWAATALGVMLKGPVALVIVSLTVVPYAIWSKRFRRFANLIGPLLFMAVLLPWLYTTSMWVPDFLSYALREETVERLTTGNFNRTAPFWFFIPVALFAVFPWTVVALAGIRRTKPDRLTMFALMWCLIPLFFFTLSQSKKPHYILPLLPAIAILAGRIGVRNGTAVKWGAVALLLLGTVLIGGAAWIATQFGASDGVIESVPFVGYSLGLISCLSAATVLWTGRSRQSPAGWMLGFPAACIPIISGPLMLAIGSDRSAREMAQVINEIAPESRVVAVRTYPLSLPFYLGRQLTLATSNGHELTSNYIARRFSSIRVTASTVVPLPMWPELATDCQEPTVFVIRSDDDDARSFLQSGLQLQFLSEDHAVYGPCGMPVMARTH